MSHPGEDAGPLDGADNWIGCGQRPEELQPIEAVSSLRLMQRRSATLARHGQPDPVDPVGHPTGPEVAVAEAARRIPAVLDSADRRLRRLFGEPAPLTVVRRAAPSGERGVAAATFSLASVPQAAERLVGTISGATTEDWYYRRPGHETSAAEITWLALYEATHYLEEVEGAFARLGAFLSREPPWTVRSNVATMGIR